MARWARLGHRGERPAIDHVLGHVQRQSRHDEGCARINTCDPSCAAGNIVRGRARLRVFQRHREDGRLVYGCLTGTTRANAETQRIQWPPGCGS
jgi:hypothetical protein